MHKNFTKNQCLLCTIICFILFFFNQVFAQDSSQEKFKSYNSFKAPLIEDNSFLIEEAFNQGAGVVQFISTCVFENFTSGNLAYSFTHEMPLKDVKHQFSYTVNYFMVYGQNNNTHGLGDVLINYRYELWGKNDWALITPRLSLILPTGDFNKGFGLDAWGSQFNLPVTKLLSNKLVTHYNAGFTYFKSAKFDFTNEEATIRKKRDLTYFNAGASVIWMPIDRLNLMLEYVSNMNDAFESTGEISKKHQMIVNPGLRYAFDMGKCQIVPGLSIPITTQSTSSQMGAFIYLSIEPNYTNK